MVCIWCVCMIRCRFQFPCLFASCSWKIVGGKITKKKKEKKEKKPCHFKQVQNGSVWSGTAPPVLRWCASQWLHQGVILQNEMSLVYSLPNRKLLPLKPNGVGSLCRLVLWSGLVGEPAVKKRRDGSKVQNNERIKMLPVKPILTRKGQKKNTSTPTKNKERRGKEIYYTDIKQSLLIEASAGWGLILWCFMNGNKEAMWHFFNKSHQKRSKWGEDSGSLCCQWSCWGLMWYLVIGGWSWVKWNFYHQWLRTLWRKACSNEQLTNFRYLLIRFVVFGHQLGEIHEVNMDRRLDS